MTIDGVNILTEYGLRLLKVEGAHDLQARKKTTEITGTDAKDIVFTAPEITFRLRGSYGDGATLITNLKAFETALKSELKHVIAEPERGLNFTGVAANGFSVKPFLRFGVALVELTFTVVEDELES